LQNVEYIGPKYGTDKDDFYEEIDILVFPTRYINEAEPLVILEAMCRGIPIIAYGRGCIPEILYADCGKVVDTRQEFVPAAMEQIIKWLWNPKVFEAASRAASGRFLEIYVQNSTHWLGLLKNLLGNSSMLRIKEPRQAF
jgi:glycosyltransferase involved in cell wall biosynthesis